jgi:hypothetical protein
VINPGPAFRDYYGEQMVMGTKGTKRRLFNNVFVQVDGNPGLNVPGPSDDVQADGNLMWGLRTGRAVQGNFFESGSEVLWDGTPLRTSFESPYALKAEVATGNLSKPGVTTVTVRLPNGTASSNSATVTVSGLSIATLTPASASPGGPGFVLTINGADFSRFSTVRWGSQTLDTAFIKSTELTAYVPAFMLCPVLKISTGTVTIPLIEHYSGSIRNSRTV